MKVARVTLTNPGPVLRIQPDLAAEIGFDEHILFLQLEYLIATYGADRDGEAWLKVPIRDLKRHCLNWWSIAKISGLLKKLESERLIRSEAVDRASGDTTKWYALDVTGVARLETVTLTQQERDGLKTSGRNVFTSRTAPFSRSERPRSDRENGRSDPENHHGEESKKEEKEPAPPAPARETTPAGSGDGVEVETILSIYERQTGLASGTAKARDRELAQTLVEIPLSAVETGIREAVASCRRAGDAVSSLRYCVPSIERAARVLATSRVGAGSPARAETSGALALAAAAAPLPANVRGGPHPVERFQGGFSDEYLGKLWQAAFDVRVALRGELAREPHTDEIRDRLYPWAAETGYDFDAVALFYGTAAASVTKEDIE